MKKKTLRRIGALIASAALSAGALMMFAGCSTDHPEVTITYTFNEKDYEVEYVLSRRDAPQTVIHFLELADAGYYDGMCIHNYTSNFLYTGGYKLVDESGNAYDYTDANRSQKTFELKEIDYLAEVKALETDKFQFTQSVWKTAGTRLKPEQGDGTYTVYGEMAGKLNNENGRENRHSTGALVMYYTNTKSKNAVEVTITRADKGKNNNGEPLQYETYTQNSATSLFYTYTSSSTNTALGEKFCVFGMAKHYDTQLEGDKGLLQAIRDYIDGYSDDEEFNFTMEQVVKLNAFDEFEEVRKAGDDNSEEPFATPINMPIIIKSVKVNKY